MALMHYSYLAILILLPDCVFTKHNVLFLVSDDMRPESNPYIGPDFPTPIHPRMHTPGLDLLAERSLVLKRAYVQQAVCSPSRTSLLTGRRPDTTRVYDLITYFRKSGGNFTTIPQYFKENGYTSIGMGKIFHPGKAASDFDDPISWSKPYYHAPNLAHYDGLDHIWRAVPKEEQERKPLPDQQIADHAIKTLRSLAPTARNGENPFFLAVGFHKPHLPHVFPEEILDYYPLENIRVPDNNYAPIDMPDVAWYDNKEIITYHDFKAKFPTYEGGINSSLPADEIKTLRRSYYCSLTFTDSLIFEILQELDKLGLRNNTIISFWGDHGWQLSEHGEWTKQTNFELATHAPMMVSIPGLTDNGLSTEQLTEFVDLYPTLVEAAGLPPLEVCPKNSSSIKLCREGESLIPLIKEPKRLWKKRVFSQYPRPDMDDRKYMGYTMRTDRYRYTEWVIFSGSPPQPQWDQLKGVELYDHNIDPEENQNRAKSPAYKLTVEGLSRLLHAGWRAA